MADKYLDFSGLSHFLDKIKNIFAPKVRGIEYIRGTWTAASNVWTGVSEDSELYDGKQIILYMPFAGNSSGATLNLTLSGGTTTGAKNVYFENTTRFTTHKGQNSQLHLIYHKAFKLSNGTTYEGWWFIANRDTTDTSSLGPAYSSYKTKDAIYRYVLLFTVDEQYLVPANSVNNDTGTSKELTTESFDPFGQIYYWNTTNTLGANATITNYLRMQQGLIDLRYSFNTGSTLTANKSVYLVTVPQSGGRLVKLDSTPISQALPTTDDGKLYIYLGQAYDTYRIQMHLRKPVYCYKNGAVRLYTDKDVVYDAGYVHTDNNYTDAEKTKLAEFTDTVTTATTTGTGNAVTSITSVNGALTVTKGETFLTSHQDISGKLDKPSGGVVGQVLAKTETGCEWKDDVTLTASVVGEVLNLTTGYTATYANADEVSY